MESIHKNFVYNVLYQLLLIALPLITAPYISRTLGATSVGIYSYTNSVAYYFLLVGMLGLANHGNRSVAAARDDQDKLNIIFSSIFSLQVMIFAFSIIVYVIYIVFFVSNNRIIAFLQLFYVISGLFDISWLFFGLEKFKLTITRNLLIKISAIVLIFVFVHNPDDLWIYTLIMSLGTLLSQIYLWWFVKKYVTFSWPGIYGILKQIKPAMILFIPVLAYSIYKVMDKIMLGNISTYEQVGYYQNAEKIINIPMGIITALGTVMLPRMSSIIANGKEEKTQYYLRLSIKFVTILCSAIGFGLIGISKILAPVYLGIDFQACAPLIMLLSITVFFVAWANVIRTQYLIPHHYDNVYLISTLVGAILNLVINIVLIPLYHSNGAAVGTIIAEFSVMFVQMIAVRKEFPAWKYIVQYVPVLIIGGIMAFLVYKLGNMLGYSITTLIIQILVGGIFFIVCLLAYMCVSKDELYLIGKRVIMDKLNHKDNCA